MFSVLIGGCRHLTRAYSTDTKALVPLTIIYLPPPSWHHPVPGKPKQPKKPQPTLAKPTTEETISIIDRLRQTIDNTNTSNWITWATKALNQLTGYDRISYLKQQVDVSSQLFQQARQHLTETKHQHTQTIQQRINNQREINSLLQRKHLWNDQDVARFTSLYRDEHQAETLERQAREGVKGADKLVDERYERLVGAIRDRYHEEQIWSDKIRRASTYGTWAVLVMNVAALFLAQAFFEPRKRQKIVEGVDERLARAMEAQNERLEESQRLVSERLDRQEQSMAILGQQLEGAVAQNNRQSSSANIMAGLDQGYSDTELDIYYNIQQQQQQQKQNRQEQEQSNNKKLLGTAAVASLVTGIVTYYFSQ